MSFSYSPDNFSVEEQLIHAERKFKELLKADVAFDELKPTWLKIKKLQKALNEQEQIKELISHNIY